MLRSSARLLAAGQDLCSHLASELTPPCCPASTSKEQAHLLGGEAVATPDQVAEKIRTARQAEKEAVAMLVLREGTTYYLALQLA